MSANGELLVFEFNGTARSGKGTIVRDISATYQAVASEETGADYRAITFALMQNGQLAPDMPPEEVNKRVERLDLDELNDLADQRNGIIATHGKDVLYSTNVNNLVYYVSPVEAVRHAVKAGFRRRVEAVRDTGKHSVLLVDGRNLDSVVSKVEGASLLMQTFVSCTTLEAAMREIERQKIDLQEGEFMQIYDDLERRNRADAERELDPVLVAPDAIDYWYDHDVYVGTFQKVASRLYGGDFTDAVVGECNASDGRSYTSIMRNGTGQKAVREDRQLHFDTTGFRGHDRPVAAMLRAAHQFFEEALDEVV